MGNNLYQEFPMFPKQMSAPVQFSTGIDTKLLTPPNSPLLRVQGALGGHEISRHIVRNHCLSLAKASAVIKSVRQAESTRFLADCLRDLIRAWMLLRPRHSGYWLRRAAPSRASGELGRSSDCPARA